MTVLRKFSTPWFWASLAGIWLLSLGLRFWGLSRFNTLVFDEVYFATFGHNYLTHTSFFDAHPPLGKYMIALGIWLKGFNPFGYRWMNAFVGSLIPLVIAGIAYQLNHRRSYALIAALFATADGLLLVESRYALINVYLLIFGLLGHWFLLLALDHSGRQRWFWLTFSAVALGGSAAVKWNGLGFLLGIYLTWFCGLIGVKLLKFSRLLVPTAASLPLQSLTQLHPLQLFIYIPAIATLVYRLIWIPHLQQNPVPGLWELQKQMLAYHERVGNGPKVHPYCSSWYTWPWMLRPVDYFYQRGANLAEPMPVIGPPLPTGATKIVYDVHAIGNPALWWFSTLAILILIGLLAQKIWGWATLNSVTSRLNQVRPTRTEEFWVPLYLVSNYAANLLPWLDVSRCTFLYHYMPAAVFSLLGIAWLVDRWLQSYQKGLGILGLTVIFLILAALVFWLPIYLGLPLSPQGFQMRMWFRSWI